MIIDTPISLTLTQNIFEFVLQISYRTKLGLGQTMRAVRNGIVMWAAIFLSSVLITSFAQPSTNKQSDVPDCM
jgi:hypothetical protein